MPKHILLEQAFRYNAPITVEKPEACTFNHRKGYWISDLTGQALMESAEYRPSTTKKCDRETGEDQKGE